MFYQPSYVSMYDMIKSKAKTSKDGDDEEDEDDNEEKGSNEDEDEDDDNRYILSLSTVICFSMQGSPPTYF